MTASAGERSDEFMNFHIVVLLLAWAWLAKPKANVVILKSQPLPKYLLALEKPALGF